MRRFTISLLAGLLLTLASLGTALGHVHGVTPLNCAGLTTENANAGGARTDATPADDDSGGPIVGVIPIGTGNAPFVLGQGAAGRHSSLC